MPGQPLVSADEDPAEFHRALTATLDAPLDAAALSALLVGLVDERVNLAEAKAIEATAEARARTSGW